MGPTVMRRIGKIVENRGKFNKDTMNEKLKLTIRVLFTNAKYTFNRAMGFIPY
jgi:hypothetical protein